MKYDHSHFKAQRAYASEINERIGNFLPMVRKLAWYYEGSCGASVDVDDLLQAGMIALTECAQRHDRPGEDVDLEDCYSDSNPAFGSTEPDAEARLLEADDRTALAEAIAQLPERLQLIVKLHFIEELNLTEIAAVLDVSVPRVHQLKSSALAKLQLAIVERSSD